MDSNNIASESFVGAFVKLDGWGWLARSSFQKTAATDIVWGSGSQSGWKGQDGLDAVS